MHPVDLAEKLLKAVETVFEEEKVDEDTREKVREAIAKAVLHTQ